LRMTAAEIAELLGMPLSTVSGILTRIGLGTLSRLEAPEPPNRYERRHAGELIHIHRRQEARARSARRRAPRDGRPLARTASPRRRLGGTSTSRSTTPPGWPASRCSTTSRPLPTPHQRQGRTLHPRPARRLGLRRHLPRQRASG
jgi:hypothetical protein